MRIIKLILELLKINPGKTIMLLSIVIGLLILNNNWNVISYDTGQVYDEFQQSGKYYYTVLAKDEKDPKVISFDKKQDVKDKRLTWEETNPLIVLLCVAEVILLICFIVGSFVDEGWEFSDAWMNISIGEVKCYEQSECFFYVFHGKLIRKDKNLYPDIETKEEKRERLLNKLLK